MEYHAYKKLGLTLFKSSKLPPRPRDEYCTTWSYSLKLGMHQKCMIAPKILRVKIDPTDPNEEKDLEREFFLMLPKSWKRFAW
jgi:hypothetical protein